MEEKLKKKVDKIKERVLNKGRKPMTADVYVLLEYIDTLEDLFNNIKDDTQRLADQSKDIMDSFSKQMGSEMFIAFDLKTGKQIGGNISDNPYAEMLKGMGGMNNIGKGHDPLDNPEAQRAIKQFLYENKDRIMEEAENIRESMVQKSGENSVEVMMFDMLMQRIERMDEDGDDGGDDGYRGYY